VLFLFSNWVIWTKSQSIKTLVLFAAKRKTFAQLMVLQNAQLFALLVERFCVRLFVRSNLVDFSCLSRNDFDGTRTPDLTCRATCFDITEAKRSCAWSTNATLAKRQSWFGWAGSDMLSVGDLFRFTRNAKMFTTVTTETFARVQIVYYRWLESWFSYFS